MASKSVDPTRCKAVVFNLDEARFLREITSKYLQLLIGRSGFDPGKDPHAIMVGEVLVKLSKIQH